MDTKIVYRELSKEDKDQYRCLLTEVTQTLQRKDFFIPPPGFADNLFVEGYARSIGAFDNDKLIGIATLLLEQNQKYKEKLDASDKKVCELGNYLVAEQYRGQGIIQVLQSKLLEIAKQLNFDIVMATVHPDNISSLKTLQKELEIVKTFEIEDGIERFLMRKNIIRTVDGK